LSADCRRRDDINFRQNSSFPQRVKGEHAKHRICSPSLSRFQQWVEIWNKEVKPKWYFKVTRASLFKRRKNMTAQYNKEMAKSYSDSRRTLHPTRQALYKRWLELCGEIQNERVLDIGSGGGVSSRLLAERGAKVLGIDNSSGMIRQAKKIEKEKPLSIKYFRLSAASPVLWIFAIFWSRCQKFHLATAMLSLHCAESMEELNRFIRNIGLSLKSEGKLVAVITDPDRPVAPHSPGSITDSRWADLAFQEGSRLEIVLFGADDKPFCTVIDYWYSKAAYESLLQKNGFINIQWSKEDDLENTILTFLTATKA
jgi:2-polyprenyl-3-methyl-5-hydroxy-6-metoxy-1,4-benzoquinol methylase